MSDIETVPVAAGTLHPLAPRVGPWLILCLASGPLFYPQPFLLTVLTQCAIFAIAAMSLDLLLGFAGMASFGQAAFFGVGAYAAALVGLHVAPALPLTLGAALLASALTALAGGVLIVRTTGIYFIFLTLALSQLIFVIAFKWRWLTGGDDGLSALSRPSLGSLNALIDLSDDRSFYIFAVGLAFASYLCLRCLIRSCFGSVLTGIRDNAHRMASIGYNVRLYKIVAFVISGALTGVAGALFTFQYGLVTPEQAHWQTSAMMMVMVILGGSGTLLGPILGAVIVVVLQNVVSSYTDRWPSIMALLFIGVVLFARGGLLGLLKNLVSHARARA